jgi:hypothetical protein
MQFVLWRSARIHGGLNPPVEVSPEGLETLQSIFGAL